MVEAKEGGQVIRYATPEELEGLPKALREVDLVVQQVRHAPGAEVPELELSGDRVAAVSPLLERWLR